MSDRSEAVEVVWFVQVRYQRMLLHPNPWFTPGRDWKLDARDQHQAKGPDDHLPTWRMLCTRERAREVARSIRAGGFYQTRVRRGVVIQRLDEP